MKLTSHMCDSVDDEIDSIILETRCVMQQINQLYIEKKTEELKSYCVEKASIIQFILNCNSDEHQKEKQAFQQLVSSYM
jgi:hypothetical protein